MSFVTVGLDYWSLGVTNQSFSAASPFGNEEDIVVSFITNGNKGDTGAQGVTGTAGSQGATGIEGSQGTAGSNGNNGSNGGTAFQ